MLQHQTPLEIRVDMEFEKLSKHEALSLVTPVIDDEVSHKTRKLFFETISEYPEVFHTYKSTQGVKELLKRRCPRAKAPDEFHRHIRSIISSQGRNDLP